MPDNIKYTRHDLSDLINRLDVDKAQLDHLFCYRDPETLDRKISGELPLTGQDQHIIDMLSDSADAGVRRLYRKDYVPSFDDIAKEMIEGHPDAPTRYTETVKVEDPNTGEWVVKSKHVEHYPDKSSWDNAMKNAIAVVDIDNSDELTITPLPGIWDCLEDDD